ncbi:uncharacterized protein [Spinacia oleracea]|uniref:Endonuclease/exonuclease/phosphatase domain-containing protein n=1 Tax=Spinacia oleracea TaxID=3562 RepID=A0ABM3QR42_SPIOL|nr:uncharacterized protein LOC110776205 [Spinacia oleracea]
MVDVPLSKELPHCISFRDENGLMVKVALYYEWRPTLCSKCKMTGHLHEECRQGKSKRVWVQKAKQVQPDATLHTVTSLVVDPEGFQRSLRPIRVRTSPRMLHLEGGTLPTLMDRIAAWNVRGLNSLQKQNEVKHFIQKYEVGLVGLLEDKVKLPNLGKLYQKVFAKWCFTSNARYHPGGRIVVAWKAGSFNVNIVAASSEFLHCHITLVSGMPAFFCTFIYAHNEAGLRQDLWRDLNLIHTTAPWILCGDFNCVMALEERIGAPVKQCDIVDMCGCMHSRGMEDLKSVGNMFTWNNKQQGNKRVFSKIERILANQAWQDAYPDAKVCFLPEGQFDHSPGLLTMYPRVNGGKKPFKYFTMWKSSPVFSDTVKTAWSTQIGGSKMFTVDYKDKHKIYLEFLSQKDKVAWLKDGDENTALFHQSIRSRNLKNQIYSIHDMGGVWKDNPTEVADAFLEYYKYLLESKHESRTPVLKKVVQLGPVCQAHHKAILNANNTADEVRAALFSIPGAKAPGLDGFGSHFYKDSWHIVGDEVVAAVLDMLQHGKILKELNHTVITLIPKTKYPKDVTEFRPISGCNTLYKCITKVLCGRLRQVLPDLILENQGGFVHGRFIVHNIMVVQDLVRQYGRKGVKPSCLMKIDL